MQDSASSYTVEQAAEVLGLTPGRVRQLLRDGHLEGTPPAAGSGQRGWSVSAESVQDRLSKQQPRPETGTAGDRGELVDSLRDQVEYLRRQLEAERRANDENRRLLAGLIERVPALEAPANPDQSPQEAERADDTSSRGPVPHEREKAAQPRPWWRKIFGG